MLPRLPAEFERQSAILLGCNELLPQHPQALVEIIGSLIEHIPLVVTVDSEERRGYLVTMLCDWGIPVHLLRYVSMPLRGAWVRDSGPSFVQQPDGNFNIIESAVSSRLGDEAVPAELASMLKLPVTRVPELVEGGNLISNGGGLCVSTTRLLLRNQQRGLDEQQVRDLLREHYGCDQLIILQPLINEPTAHVDVFATFVAEDTVVVGEYDRKVDPINADVLDYNARLLSGAQTRSGKLKVLRIPMPANHGGYWHTYTNVIYANGRLLVPRYPFLDEATDRAALQFYANLLRGWQIIGVDATTLVHQRGAPRWISMNIPYLGDAAQPTFRL